MGTYAKLVVKNTKEDNLSFLNKNIQLEGYSSKVYNHILFGPFITQKMLQEYARFLNEDPEGLKQITHQPRPITIDYLKEFFWNTIGQYNIKLSASTQEEIDQMQIVFSYAFNHPKYFDWKKSENCTKEKLAEYGIEVPEMYKSKAKKLKEELKKTLGYNQRQVSLKENHCSTEWIFNLTIRDTQVDYHKVKTWCKANENHDRDDTTGEILLGGNTYIHLNIDSKVSEVWSAPYKSIIGQALLSIKEDGDIVTIDNFSFRQDSPYNFRMKYKDEWQPMNYMSMGGIMPLDMYLVVIKERNQIKANVSNKETLTSQSNIEPIKEPVMTLLSNKATPESNQITNDLLEKFSKIEVKYTSRISETDLKFCQENQSIFEELTTMLKQQLAFFENKYENGTANPAFHLNNWHDKYSVSLSSSTIKQEYRWDQSLKYSPLYAIAAIKNNLNKANTRFIHLIKTHFESQYHIDLKLESLLKVNKPTHFETILEFIFQETDGLDLFDAGIAKIKSDFIKQAWRGALLKNKRVCFESFVHYSTITNTTVAHNSHGMSELLLALSYFESESTKTLPELKESIPYGYYNDSPNVTFETISLEDYDLRTLEKAKLYKNGNVDITFKTSTLAREFYQLFNLETTLKTN